MHAILFKEIFIMGKRGVTVIVDWLFVVRSDALCSKAGCSGTVSSGTNNSGIRTESLLVVEAIS